VISTASPTSPGAFGVAETGSDYLATETHYLSVAGRTVYALRESAAFVLVTGDPPPDSLLLSQALRRPAELGYTVTPISCGYETTVDQLLRAGSVVATLAAGGGITTVPESLEAAPPLFLLSELDGLPAPQIEKICEAARHGPRSGAAAVLLARTGFLARLEEPALQSVKELLAVQLNFEEIGKDEGIDFLRHQLAVRHRPKETRGILRGVVRAVAAFAILLAAAITGFMLLQRFYVSGDVSLPAVPPPTAKQATSTIPDKPPTEGASAPAILNALPLDPVPQPSRSPSAPPLQSPTVQRLPPAEIAVLVTRGDDFLKAGDIASARLFYERAADAGDGAAALRLGATFDPGLLARAGIRGIPGDPAMASAWYRRARDLGDAAAAERLKGLERQPPAEPGSAGR
jgi:hypothetical protein